MKSSGVSISGGAPRDPCSRCEDRTRSWDRIAGTVFCPNCIELLMQGLTPPLRMEVDAIRARCALCVSRNTVAYQTTILHRKDGLQLPLCGDHLRNLAARRLTPYDFKTLSTQIARVGVSVEDIFLLHSAFYDHVGRALQPTQEMMEMD